MPRRLLDRCQPDSIREFRSAAKERLDDGLCLASQGRRTGAIYVWGYAVEMLLKAAYFSLIGIHDAQIITVPGQIIPAVKRGRSLGIAWPAPGQGHNVLAWAGLLVAERGLSPATSFPVSFSLELQNHAQQMWWFWRETLRYRKNFAYAYELRRVQQATEWFFVHSAVL